MNKKKWAFILLCSLLLLGYYKFFYKTWNNTGVSKNADYIVAIDVKRVTNTLIWNFITTPSQWKTSSIFSSDKDKVSWDDMVKLPDYVFIFHAANQPANAWYTVAEINDRKDFEKGLQQFHFEKRGADEYFSASTGLEFILHGEQLLLGNGSVENKQCIRQVARELFEKKEYATGATLQKNVDAASHFSLLLPANQLLEQAAVLTANFSKTGITIDALLSPKKQYISREDNFSYSDSSLCTLAFTQPAPELYALLPDTARAGISRALNFNIDSLLLPGNNNYQLDIAAIIPRVDSAVTYTYDDNFNALEKVVVNNVEEPAFNFLTRGKDAGNVYQYWKNSGKLEKTPAGEWFTPLPFVRSYCSQKTGDLLELTSNNYTVIAPASKVNGIFLLQVLLTKIPASLLKYFPAELTKAIRNIESFRLILQKESGQVALHARFNKKPNNLPVIEW